MRASIKCLQKIRFYSTSESIPTKVRRLFLDGKKEEALKLVQGKSEFAEEEGNIHYFSGNFEEALKCFQYSNRHMIRTLQLTKDSTSFQHLLQNLLKQGIIYMNLGQFDQSEYTFLKGVQYIHENPSLLLPISSSTQDFATESSYLLETDFLYKLAQLYLFRSECPIEYRSKYEKMEAEKFIHQLLEKSIEYFEKSIQKSSSSKTNTDSHFGIGVCLQRLGKADEAKQLFEKIVNEIDKTFYAAYLSLGDIFYFKKEFKDAAAYYKEFVEHYQDFCDQISKQGDRAINREAIYFETLLKLGLSHIQIGDYNMSIILFTKLLEIEGLPIQWKAIAHNKRGLCYLKLGEYNKCIAEQTSAINFSDKYIDAYRDRAMAFEMIGKYEEAAEDNRQREFLTRAKVVAAN